MGLLTGSLSHEDLADCDLIIEAVFELMAIKKEVFTTLDRIAKPGAILASNTSYLDINEIAAVTCRPEAVLGLHFFSPANVMRLLEVVRGAKTAPAVIATAMDLARRMAKVAVVSGVCHGFIGNRMLEPRRQQAFATLLEGAAPAAWRRARLQHADRRGAARFRLPDGAVPDGGSRRARYRLGSGHVRRQEAPARQAMRGGATRAEDTATAFMITTTSATAPLPPRSPKWRWRAARASPSAS